MNRFLLIFFFTGTIAMIFVMSKTGKGLNEQSATPHGILNLELAYNSTATASIIKAWSASSEQRDYISIAKNNTYWDFLFLFFYAFFLFLLCRKIAAGYTSPKAGKIFAVAALAAGVFDIGENMGMLQTLNGNQSGHIAMFTAGCSVIKWALVIVSVIYVVIAGAILLLKKASGRSLN